MNHAEPTIDQLEAGLRARLRTSTPEYLASAIDGRVERALSAAPSKTPWRSRRRVPLALAAALALAGLAGGAALGGPIREATITVIDGIRFSDDVRGYPGLTNPGQPFWNTPLFELPPDEAHQLVVDRGYPIRWQVEDRGGTVDDADDSTRFTESAPDCGRVEGGSLIDGVAHMLVLVDDPKSPESACE